MSEGSAKQPNSDRPLLDRARKPWATPVVIVSAARDTDVNLKGFDTGDYVSFSATFGS